MKYLKIPKKMLHSFMEMSKFYLNKQYLRKLVRNFLSWSPFFEYLILAYFFFKFQILNFLFITIFSTYCLIQICINLENRLVTFWFEVRFIWRQTDGHPRIRNVDNSSRSVKFFTQIEKFENEYENIMPSHFMGKS